MPGAPQNKNQKDQAACSECGDDPKHSRIAVQIRQAPHEGQDYESDESI